MEPARCAALAGRGDRARVRPMPDHMELVGQNRPGCRRPRERIQERLYGGIRMVVSKDGGGWSRPLPPVSEKKLPQRFHTRGAPKEPHGGFD